MMAASKVGVDLRGRLSVDTFLYIKHACVRGCDCSRQDKRPRHRKETAEAKFSQVVSVHEFVTQRLSGSGSGSGRRRAVLMCCCRSLFCLVITPQGTRRVCVLCSPLPRALSPAVSLSAPASLCPCLPQRGRGSESQPAHTSARSPRADTMAAAATDHPTPPHHHSPAHHHHHHRPLLPC